MAPTTAPPKPPTTLGLTGLTSNAMALIAPGAFLWLTFFIQSAYGAPLAAQGMWFGIAAAVVLCLATAIAYAELSKLYPGRGIVLLLRRAGLPVESEVPEVCAYREVHRRVGQSPVLLGISGVDGGRHRPAGRLRARPGLARHVQRGDSEPAVHDYLLPGVLRSASPTSATAA